MNRNSELEKKLDTFINKKNVENIGEIARISKESKLDNSGYDVENAIKEWTTNIEIQINVLYTRYIEHES